MKHFPVCTAWIKDDDGAADFYYVDQALFAVT
jgi:hypothetical protein